MGQVLQFKRKTVEPVTLPENIQVLLALKQLLPVGKFVFIETNDGKSIKVQFQEEEVQAVAVALPVPEDAIGDDDYDE